MAPPPSKVKPIAKGKLNEWLRDNIAQHPKLLTGNSYQPCCLFTWPTEEDMLDENGEETAKYDFIHAQNAIKTYLKEVSRCTRTKTMHTNQDDADGTG